MSTDTRTEGLITRWIEPNPHKPGSAEALVLPRRVSVWAVVGQIELEHGRLQNVAEAYDLPAEAVEAAVSYHERHRAEIDARIARNRAFFAP